MSPGETPPKQGVEPVFRGPRGGCRDCTLVLVTHALTVGPLVGFLPNQGETVVLKPGPGRWAGADLVGRVAAPR